MSPEGPLHKITSWAGKLRRSLRLRGIAGTARYACELIACFIGYHYPRLWYDFRPRHFDRKFGVETAGPVYLPELENDPKYQHAVHYDPSSYLLIRKTLASIPADLTEFTFVDIGCGKGKVLLVASGWPFREIIGVELSAALLEVAKRNIATYRAKKRCQNIRLVCTDARDYELPPGNSVLYFFNPFEEPVMRVVVENIGRAMVRSRRELYLIFVYPVLRAFTDTVPFLSLVRKSLWYQIYKVAPPVNAVPRCRELPDADRIHR